MYSCIEQNRADGSPQTHGGTHLVSFRQFDICPIERYEGFQVELPGILKENEAQFLSDITIMSRKT